MAHRPAVVDVCDVCGSPLVARDDDNPAALAVRLREYHEKTAPVIALFQRKEFVASIDATQSIDAIQDEIRAGGFGACPHALRRSVEASHLVTAAECRCDTPCSRWVT